MSSLLIFSFFQKGLFRRVAFARHGPRPCPCRAPHPGRPGPLCPSAPLPPAQDPLAPTLDHPLPIPPLAPPTGVVQPPQRRRHPTPPAPSNAGLRRFLSVGGTRTRPPPKRPAASNAGPGLPGPGGSARRRRRPRRPVPSNGGPAAERGPARPSPVATPASAAAAARVPLQRGPALRLRPLWRAPGPDPFGGCAGAMRCAGLWRFRGWGRMRSRCRLDGPLAEGRWGPGPADRSTREGLSDCRRRALCGTRTHRSSEGGRQGSRSDSEFDRCAVCSSKASGCDVLHGTAVHCTVWHRTVPYSSCCAVRCCGVLCCAVLCCAVLCCAVLCAVLCCAVLCSVLCCAVLCCAVLCCSVQGEEGGCDQGRSNRIAKNCK